MDLWISNLTRESESCSFAIPIIIAIISGIVSLIQIKRSSEAGKGFALAGIILTIVEVMLALYYVPSIFSQY
jgi:hypothetical protein